MLLRYGSPVIWEASSLPKKVRIIADINPITAFLNSYRNIFLYNSPPEITILLLFGTLSIVLIVSVIYLYNKTEHKIVKVL